MSNGFDFLIYKAADEEVSVNAVIKDDTIWLTQKSMAELFEVDRSVINKHLKNIYESGELKESLTYAKFAQVQNEGSRQVKRNIDFYNLDAIISVGYRVNSKRATHFRQWATGVERTVTGYFDYIEDLKPICEASPKGEPRVSFYPLRKERVKRFRASEIHKEKRNFTH